MVLVSCDGLIQELICNRSPVIVHLGDQLPENPDRFRSSLTNSTQEIVSLQLLAAMQ